MARRHGRINVPVEDVDAPVPENALDFIELRKGRKFDPEPFLEPVVNKPQGLRRPVFDKDVFKAHGQPEAAAPSVLRFVQVGRRLDPAHRSDIGQSAEHVFTCRRREIQIDRRKIRDFSREQRLGQVVGIVGYKYRFDTLDQVHKGRTVRHPHLMHHIAFVPAEMGRCDQNLRALCRQDVVESVQDGGIGRCMQFDAVKAPVPHLQKYRVEDIFALGPEKDE